MSVTVKIDGLRQLSRALSKADMPKAIGRAHKEYGQVIANYVNRRASPAAVGRGRGADLRPSAAKRELKLRVGGSHRAQAVPVAQWGRTYVGEVGTARPKRPYIKKIATDRFDGDEYLDAIEREIGLDIRKGR